MKICFIYDDQKDYDISNDIEYADFCLKAEAELIVKSLEELGNTVDVLKGKKDFISHFHDLKKYDLVFNKTEGFNSRNREGIIPAILEYIEVPFTGTDAYGFSLSLNKYHTKLVAAHNDLITPDFVMIHNEDDFGKIERLKLPIIIKPICEGSSMGCSVHYAIDDNLRTTIKALLKKYRQDVIAEEYITGIDLSIPIIGNGDEARCLGIVYFSNKDGSFPEIASTEFKYISDYQTKLLEADDSLMTSIKDYSLAIYHALDCKDYARVDIRLHDKTPYFLEINPLPTLCEHGAFDVCAKAIGMEMRDVIKMIIESAMRRYCV